MTTPTHITLKTDRLVRFVVGCQTPKGEEYAIIHVYFPLKGSVNVQCPAGLGFHLTRKGQPANWATFGFKQWLRENMPKNARVPTYAEIAGLAEHYRDSIGANECRVGELSPDAEF